MAGNQVLDNNTWFSIISTSPNGNSSLGLFGNDAPITAQHWVLIAWQTFELGDNDFKWQFYPSPGNSSQYIIRAQGSGSGPWLTTGMRYVREGYDCGQPEPGCEYNNRSVGMNSIVGPSALWTLVEFEGQTVLSSVANGTDFTLSVNAEMTPRNSTAGNVSPASVVLEELGNIDDEAYSTVNAAFTPSSSTAPTNTATTATSTNSPSPTPTSSSVDVGAIVGGVIGGVACLALVLIGLILYRRRRRRQQRANAIREADAADEKRKEGGEGEEADSNLLYEAPGQNQIYQAPTGEPNRSYELSGDTSYPRVENIDVQNYNKRGASQG